MRLRTETAANITLMIVYYCLSNQQSNEIQMKAVWLLQSRAWGADALEK